MNYKKILLILLPVVAFINMFTGIIPLILFVFMLLGVQFYCLNRFESSFLLLMFASVFGVFFNIYGIRGIGSVLLIIALFIALYEERRFIKRIWNYSVPLIIILLYLGISVFITTGGDYAGEKLSRTCVSAVLTVIPFALFFSKIENFNLSKLALMVCTYGFFTFAVGMEYMNLPRISSMFDIGYFRVQMALMDNNNADVEFNYQSIGFYGCFAMSLLGFYNNPSIKNNTIVRNTIYFLSSLVVLFSGSRQSILAWLILIVIIQTKGRIFSKRIIIAGTILILLWQWFQSLDIWLFTDLQTADNLLEGSGRDKIIESGISQFKSSPLYGVGYGRFVWNNEYGNYPHNFFVELLCECGIIGTILILSIPIYYFFKRILRSHITYVNMVGAACIIIPYIVRAMVSADLSWNIELFAILFMIPLFKHNHQNNNLIKNDTNSICLS